MSRINVDLSQINSQRPRCAKPKCKTGDFTLHRHHKGHQFLFVAMFSTRRLHQPRYIEFVERYYSYNEEDVVRVCGRHHREIHQIYEPLINDYEWKAGRDLADFTWGQAEELMNILIARCNKWLSHPSKGSSIPWPSNGKTKRNAEEYFRFLDAIGGSPF